MSELTFTPSLDGYVMRDAGSQSEEDFSTVRDSAGTLAGTTQDQIPVRLWAGYNTDKWDDIIRVILLFNTSSIPDNVTILSATLKLYVTVAADMTPIGGNFNIFSADPVSDDALVAADYGTLGTTPYATAIDPDDMTVSEWITFTLNSIGLAAISKTGLTKLGIREAVFDAGNTTPTWASRDACKFQFYSRLESGYEPILTVVYGNPTVTTQECTNTIAQKSTGHGNLTSIGDAAVTQHGHCWATSASPTTSDNLTENGAKPNLGQFQSDITGLTPGVLYYVAAYATNSYGTSYGSDVEIAGDVTTIGKRYRWVQKDEFHFFGEDGVHYYVKGIKSTAGLPWWYFK